MRGWTYLWELIFSYIPITVRLHWGLSAIGAALDTEVSLCLESFTEELWIQLKATHELRPLDNATDSRLKAYWNPNSTDTLTVRCLSPKRATDETFRFEASSEYSEQRSRYASQPEWEIPSKMIINTQVGALPLWSVMERMLALIYGKQRWTEIMITECTIVIRFSSALSPATVGFM